MKMTLGQLQLLIHSGMRPCADVAFGVAQSEFTVLSHHPIADVKHTVLAYVGTNDMDATQQEKHDADCC